jgi:hypothetical protein
MSRFITLFTLFTASLLAPTLNAEVLFQENFDNQPDYVSKHSKALNITGGSEVIPNNWYAIRQSSTFGRESIEILSSNASKARGKTGKSAVLRRESVDLGPTTWISEGLLLQYLPVGQKEIYVSFWVRFGDVWTKDPGWTTKMFRIYSWDETTEITKYFSTGGSGPIALWDYEPTSYGIRNRWSFRGGPHGENYKMSNISGFPRPLGASGDASLNYTQDTIGQGVNGTTPKIPDRVNGGFISDNMNQTVKHDQIYGANGTWTKLSFYVKMNSAPGVADGQMKQWINDELILSSNKIPWVGPTSSPMPKWNVIAFGGNSYFAPVPASAQYEEWYSIDDIYIANTIPGTTPPPKPPSNINIK